MHLPEGRGALLACKGTCAYVYVSEDVGAGVVAPT